MSINQFLLQDSFGITSWIKTCRIQRLLEHTRLLHPHPPLQRPQPALDLRVVLILDGKGILELIVTRIKGRNIETLVNIENVW